MFLPIFMKELTVGKDGRQSLFIATNWKNAGEDND